MAATHARILHKERVSRFPVDEFLYVIKVRWSYGVRTLTKRSYSEFYSLQCRLLDIYSDTRGVMKILPRLPGRRFFPVNATKLAEERITGLNVYLDKLVHLPQEISRSELVLSFLEPDTATDDPADSDSDPETIIKPPTTGHLDPKPPTTGLENLGYDETARDSSEDEETVQNSIKQSTDDAVFSPCDVGDIIHTLDDT